MAVVVGDSLENAPFLSREFTVFPISPQFHEIHTARSPFFPFIVNYFKMAFCLHSIKVQAFPSLVEKARTNDVQTRTTCRTRPVSSTSHKRTSSGRTPEHDRRVHCAGNRSRGSGFGRSNTRGPRGS